MPVPLFVRQNLGRTDQGIRGSWHRGISNEPPPPQIFIRAVKIKPQGFSLIGGLANGAGRGGKGERDPPQAEAEGARGGNREQVAKLLGFGERTLYRKLKAYGLR